MLTTIQDVLLNSIITQDVFLNLIFVNTVNNMMVSISRQQLNLAINTKKATELC